MSFLVPPPNPYLHQADGWTIPPLDGSLSVPEIYDFHYEHNPNHPVFVYSNLQGELTHVHYSEFIPAVHRAGWYTTRITNYDHSIDISDRPVVGILAASDTITFMTTILGMFRGGFPVIPISPRNSPAAIAHLLTKTRPTHLFVSVETSIHELMNETISLMDENDKPAIVPMPIYEELYTNEKEFERLPPRQRDILAMRMIVHSSGSTSFPKPIFWTDRTCAQASMAPWFGVTNYTGKVFAAHCLAMYHAIGINFMNWISMTGLVMAVFPPASPSTIPSIANVYDGMVSVNPQFIFVPPFFLEAWSKDPEKIRYMKKVEGILFGGGPMSTTIGDQLAREGCKLYSLYGITEVGVLGQHIPPPTGMDWEYLQMNPSIATDFSPQDDGTYELILISNPHTDVLVINSKWKGEDAYATNDLFLPHPSLPGHWKLIGRKDDQLMLSTGEKTNPTPLEAILSGDPHVHASLMFGRGRFQNGILVQLKPQFAFDTSDEEAVIKYRNLIWPSIEKMNDFGPSHSRLFKEMIIFANPSKPFSFNAKGAARRSVVLSEYDREIEALYQSLDQRVDGGHPSVWTFESSLDFVRAVVNKNLMHPAKDDEDIFECGCDSLQATWIRNSIIAALRDKWTIKARAIGSNFIYENPRITLIATFLSETTRVPSPDIDKPAALMQSMLKNLGSFTATPIRTNSNIITRLLTTVYNTMARLFLPNKVVLITGTTGGLGAGTLAKLIKSKSVKKIYALNRPSKSGKSVIDRQRTAFESKGYSPELASHPKLVLLEGEITEKGLGVEESVDRQIRSSVTHIIHVAWRVDFNLKLQSFENILKGMRTLIDVALMSPHSRTPNFVFTSSIGVLRGIPLGVPVPEEPINDPTLAVGQGYGESKWVGEQMLYKAAQETSLRPVIVRTGQIAGGLNGGWNTSDWVPGIVKSSLPLGCLPQLEGTCSWIPLDLAADAIVDFAHADENVRTVHLVHPRPQPTADIFKTFSERMGLPLVPYSEWVKRLEASSASAEDVPALKLLDFFQGGTDTSFQDQKTLVYEVATKSSRHLEKAQPIRRSEVESWLDYWAKIGFISPLKSN